MPIYEYRCEDCGHEFETIQKVSEAPLKTCPACASETLRKKVSASGFRLKGGGWYETDFKAGKKRNVAGDEKPSSSSDKPSSDSSGGGGKSEGGKSEGGKSEGGKSEGGKSEGGKSDGRARSGNGTGGSGSDAKGASSTSKSKAAE